MSRKSLGEATLGLLKRGAKKALHIASLGLLRVDDDQPEQPTVQASTFTTAAGIRIEDLQRVQNNNLVLILASDGVLW